MQQWCRMVMDWKYLLSLFQAERFLGKSLRHISEHHTFINAAELIIGLMSRQSKTGSLWYISVCLSSVVDTLSHPPVVFSFRPCELLKEPWSLKSFKAEVSESGRKKNWARLKEDFVFWWLALPKRVSLGRQRGTGWRVKGAGGVFGEMGRDVNYGLREKEVC